MADDVRHLRHRVLAYNIIYNTCRQIWVRILFPVYVLNIERRIELDYIILRRSPFEVRHLPIQLVVLNFARIWLKSLYREEAHDLSINLQSCLVAEDFSEFINNIIFENDDGCRQLALYTVDADVRRVVLPFVTNSSELSRCVRTLSLNIKIE